MPIRKIVDNSGQGNCLYYAYSISLMFYLLNQPEDVAELIFNKLKLTDKQKEQLHEVLKSKKLNDAQIRQIIEPILGPATRAAAAEQTVSNILNTPENSAAHSAMHYALYTLFRGELVSQKSPYSAVLENKPNNPVFTRAEIFRLFPMKKDGVLHKFIKSEYASIIGAFQTRWAKKQPTLINTTPKNIQFHQELIFSEILSEKTMDYFTLNENAHLNAFHHFLGKNFAWAEAEMLYTLHRFIQGEQMIHLENGSAEWVREIDISLSVLANGHPQSHGDEDKHFDIVLNNIGNVHWVSVIQASEKYLSEIALLKTKPPIVLEHPHQKGKSKKTGVLESSKKEKEVHEESPLFSECPNIDIEISLEGDTQREANLTMSGFNDCLEQLRIETFTPYLEPQVKKDIDEVYEQLLREKMKFISSPKMKVEEFSGNCEAILKEGLQTSLGKHQGFNKILNHLLEVVVSIANVFIHLANLFNGKYQLIDPNDLIPTEPAYKLQHIHQTLFAISAKEKNEHLSSSMSLKA